MLDLHILMQPPFILNALYVAYVDCAIYRFTGLKGLDSEMDRALRCDSGTCGINIIVKLIVLTWTY